MKGRWPRVGEFVWESRFGCIAEVVSVGLKRVVLRTPKGAVLRRKPNEIEPQQ